MSIWFSFFVAAFALAYLVKVLMLEEKEDHEGPWPALFGRVYFPESEHLQRVALFDRIRRIFGVYIIEDNLWTVNEARAELWTCPVCLSFWVALPISALLLLSEPFWQSPFLLILPFALSSASRLIVKYAFGV